jgi:hypothetical protein
MTADPAVIAVIEYGLATMLALDALAGTDERMQLTACLCWADTVGAIGSLSVDRRNEALAQIVARGHVPEEAWAAIEHALEKFAAAGDRRAMN